MVIKITSQCSPYALWTLVLTWTVITNFLVRKFCGKTIQGNSPETMWKLCLSAKFPHQKIRWNYGIFRSCLFIYFIDWTGKRINWDYMKWCRRWGVSFYRNSSVVVFFLLETGSLTRPQNTSLKHCKILICNLDPFSAGVTVDFQLFENCL